MLNSGAAHICDFTPLFSAPERSAIIGIAGAADSSCASRRGRQRGGGEQTQSGQPEVGRVGWEKACLIHPLPALTATGLHLDDAYLGDGEAKV